MKYGGRVKLKVLTRPSDFSESTIRERFNNFILRDM